MIDWKHVILWTGSFAVGYLIRVMQVRIRKGRRGY